MPAGGAAGEPVRMRDSAGMMNDQVAENHAVRSLYHRLIDAWNRRDPDAFGALFARDGRVVGFDGSQVTGAELADYLRSIFTDHPTAAYVSIVRDVRALGERAALL